MTKRNLGGKSEEIEGACVSCKVSAAAAKNNPIISAAQARRIWKKTGQVISHLLEDSSLRPTITQPLGEG